MNFNRGSIEGGELMDRSFEQFGAGRSILLDKDNNIIAGNKTAEAAEKQGIRRVRIVESDGTRLVVVKRTDISLDSRKGRELAMADNATALVNLVWDKDMLEQAQELCDGLNPEEWGVTKEDLIGSIASQGEIDTDLFQDEQKLKLRFTGEQYDAVCDALQNINEVLPEAVLTLLGYYDTFDE